MLTRIDHDGIVELRLERPPVNALNAALLTTIGDGVAAAADAGAIVLSGQPGMFSGGLDLHELLAADRAGVVDVWERFYGAMAAIAASPVPVIAAITGHSAAGGTVLALFCDHRVAPEGDAKIGLNEVQVGIPLPEVVYAAARRLVGVRNADFLATTGALLDPAAALALGLVDELSPATEVVERALARAEERARLPRHAARITRERARRDLVAIVAAVDRTAVERQVDEHWFHPETQSVLAAVAARLRSKARESR